MEARQFVAGLAMGTALVVGGRVAASFEAGHAAETVIDIGEATVALDGLAYGGTLFAEERRRRAEAERAEQDATAGEQAGRLPNLAEEWLGLHTLHARLDKAVQGKARPEHPLNLDSAVFLQEVVRNLSERHRKLAEDNRFVAVLDGVRESLVNEYTGAFLMPVPGTLSPEIIARQRTLEGIFELLDWAAPIKPVNQGRSSPWRSYLAGQAIERITAGVVARHLTTATTIPHFNGNEVSPTRLATRRTA